MTPNATIAMPKSPQEPQVKGPEMNDRDRVNDLLAMEKYLTSAYNTALNEMQNPKVHQTIQRILNDVHQIQFQVFDQMWQKGWYKIKASNPQEVQQAYQQFSNYKTQIPSF